MISIRDLHFSYPRSFFDLRIEELQFAAEQATAVVGPSGSGKTTLLHILAGILPVNQGTILVGETEVSALSDAARRAFRLANIGLIFQNFELIEYLNVRDNILLPCRINSAVALTRETRERAEVLAELVRMQDHLAKPVTRLSQGERQRVAICRALLTKPHYLLADEPTGNLDPATSEQILNLLFDAVAAERSTLVMVTHDHSLLPRFANTVDFSQFLSVSETVQNGAAD